MFHGRKYNVRGALRYRRTMKMLPRNSGRQLSVEYTVYFGFTRLYYFCVLLDFAKVLDCAFSMLSEAAIMDDFVATS